MHTPGIYQFNHKRVVEELDFEFGTEGMHCDCSTSKYCYEPVGHVATGDLILLEMLNFAHCL